MTTQTQADLDTTAAADFRSLTGRLVAVVLRHQADKARLRSTWKEARKARREADEALAAFLEGACEPFILLDALGWSRRCGELTRAAEAASEADRKASDDYHQAIADTRRSQMELRLTCTRYFQQLPLFDRIEEGTSEPEMSSDAAAMSGKPALPPGVDVKALVASDPMSLADLAEGQRVKRVTASEFVLLGKDGSRVLPFSGLQVHTDPPVWINFRLLPNGRAEAFAPFGRLGNWSESRLPDGAVYWPDADELSQAASKAAGVPLRLHDWHTSDLYHELAFVPAVEAPIAIPEAEQEAAARRRKAARKGAATKGAATKGAATSKARAAARKETNGQE